MNPRINYYLISITEDREGCTIFLDTLPRTNSLNFPNPQMQNNIPKYHLDDIVIWNHQLGLP